jgi:HEAT repeat protein
VRVWTGRLVTLVIVAALAAAGYGYSRFVDSTDYLVRVVTNGTLPADRIGAIDRLAARQEPAVVPALARALDDRDDDVRVKALERLDARRAAVPALVRIAIEGERPRDRRWAVGQLADRNDPSILPTLVRASDDRDATVRQAALEQRAARRDPALMAALVAALAWPPAEGFDAVPRTAARLLGQLPAEQAFDPIMQALPTQHDADVIDKLVAALGRFGDARAAPAMLAAVDQLDHPSLGRERIIKAIATLPPKASAALVGALTASEPAARGNAALAVADFVTSHPETAGAFVAPVLKAMHDPSGMVKGAAWQALYAVIRALGRAGGPAALPALQTIFAAIPYGGLRTSPGLEIFGAALADVGADAFPFVLKLGLEWSIEISALSEFARRQPALRAKAIAALVDLAVRKLPEQRTALLALFEFRDGVAAAAVAPLLQEPDREIAALATRLIFMASAQGRALVLDAFHRDVNAAAIAGGLADTAIKREPGWEAAAAELDAALKDNNLAAGSGAYRYFIDGQRVDAVAYLKLSLSQHGDAAMAEALMNSGNTDLSAYAQAWARERGLEVISLPARESDSRPSWGGQ